MAGPTPHTRSRMPRTIASRCSHLPRQTPLRVVAPGAWTRAEIRTLLGHAQSPNKNGPEAAAAYSSIAVRGGCLSRCGLFQAVLAEADGELRARQAEPVGCL